MSQRTLTSTPYINSNLFSSYYLDERIDNLDEWDCDDAASTALDALRRLYEDQRAMVAAYDEDNLRSDWIDPVLSILGHQTLSETPIPESGGFADRLLFGSDEARMDAVHLRDDGQTSAVYGRGLAVLEAKQWDADFEQRFHENRQYRDASHQIKYYLERTPESIQWGILTNGRKWRLYGTRDYETQTFYEVDLPELIEMGTVDDFKYFFAFFRAAAFSKVDGISFLERVWSESETAAQELGEDLQNNVFTALRVLGEGFVESNNLAIQPGDEEALRELKEQSLVLLYRLMFILYAEARGLIHPDTHEKVREYNENFSIDNVRVEIYDTVSDGQPIDTAYSVHSTSLWSRFSDLFHLIDEGNADLSIPAYNGGLFDRDENSFLAENEVDDLHLAKVIYRLSTTEGDRGMVLADYADLDTRHLGSIYEGLLEHQFRLAEEDMVAVREDGVQVWKPASEVATVNTIEEVSRGELYVVNDQGERKATGAYYTPDYVVTYIIEETLGPLLEEIRGNLAEEGFDTGTQEYVFQLGNRVLDLAVLDPAMGSGHFLTKTTGYLAEQVQEEARQAEIEDIMREEQVRRQVAKEVIYGVDINPMAVELAKLSMWLETLAADQPLAFLDHHLKVGNSLVGSDIEAIEGLETDAGDGDQSSLADFGAVRRGTIEHLMDVHQEFLAIENEDLADVKAMERKYEEIEQDELRQRLVAMANVHTAERFGVEVPDTAFEKMAEALRSSEKWAEIQNAGWFEQAQVRGRNQLAFHWKLEYPEVFYDADGEPKAKAGFDVVVGNPPYVSNWELTASDESLPSSLEKLYPEVTSGHWDLYVPFSYRGISLTHEDGRCSFITPSSLGTEKYGRKLREFMIRECTLEQLVTFEEFRVFEEVDRQYLIYVVRPSAREDSQTRIVRYNYGGFETDGSVDPNVFLEYSNNSFRVDITEQDLNLKNKIDEQSIRLGNLCCVNPGVVAHSAEDSPLDFNKSDVVSSDYEPGWKKYISGSDIERHRVEWQGEYMDYDSKQDHFHRPKFPKLFESPKIMFSGVSGSNDKILSCHDEKGYYSNHNINHAVKWTSEIKEYKSPSDYDVFGDVEKYDLKFVAGVVNSILDNYYFGKFLATGTLQGSYTGMYPEDIRSLPIPEIDFGLDGWADIHSFRRFRDQYHEKIDTGEIAEITEVINDREFKRGSPALHDIIAFLTDEILELNQKFVDLNLYLPDYLGNYSDGPTLTDLDGFQPPSGVADSLLAETTATRDNLRIGQVEVEGSSDSLSLLATARYKPEDEDTHETDQWGYTETIPLPAMEFRGLSEAQAAIIHEFVPYAVDQSGGFANFRNTATRNISLLDRLEGLTLPQLEDIENGLERYIESKDRAQRLDQKIQRTDKLIDQFVYQLYGLTEEEIEVIEQAVIG